MRQAISMATVLAMSLSSAYRGTPAYASTADAGGRCTKTELSRRVGRLGCERTANNWLSWQSRAISTVVGAPSDGIDALVVLAGIPVRKEHPAGYRRTLFPLWLDVDGDGCNTRSQVLRRESLVPRAQTPGCRVVIGSWQSSYDGAVLTNPADATVDHVVSLKETWDSGAWAWDKSTRTAYANDTTDRRTLRIVSRAVNSAKGDRDPSNWLPPAPADRCLYLGDWLAVKARWHLSMDESEWGRVRNLLTRECPGWRVAPSSDPPLSAASRSALLAAPDAHPNASPPAGNPTHGAPSALPAVSAAVAPAVRHEPLRCTRVAPLPSRPASNIPRPS